MKSSTYLPTDNIISTDPIKHVVFLMMENQSFDRKLGDVKKIKPEIEGIDPDNLHYNYDEHYDKIYQKETTALQMPLDPLHDDEAVHQQLLNHNAGFVHNFVANYPTCTFDDKQGVMSYYPYGFLPATHALAAEFTVCDHWFSSVPGPTWTNRFFALSGTSNGRVKMIDGLTDFYNYPQLFYQNQTNIFDRLDENGISWKCYCGDFPISLVLTHNREPDKLNNYHIMDQFYQDANGPEEDFPQFSFIEPKYLGADQNDDHPPHNTMKAERLIADIYNALRRNNELWMSILLVLVYDEHGGFYDHVEPPAALPPDDHKEEYTFDRLGLRVPAILISPWAKKSLEKTVFDHTSLLKYLIEKWDLGELGERTRHANNIDIALDTKGQPRNDCMGAIFIPDGIYNDNKMALLESNACNDNHTAIHAFADFINKTEAVKTVPDIAPLSKGAKLKDKIGRKLELHGFWRTGKWLRKTADQHRKAEIDRTLKIADNKLAMFHTERKFKRAEKLQTMKKIHR
ncbi:MAG TPA: alkaline phosphatase family protein [Gammaproteobacteria bacterium]|nr:alkaline phosphatase family protein [Gammaproteobacteria bacterium]